MIYIDDDQNALIRTLGASSSREKSCARERLVAMGINPDTQARQFDTYSKALSFNRRYILASHDYTLETLSHDVQMASGMPYLDYLARLLPQQRRETIADLAQLTWGTDNQLFLDDPKIAPELQRLGIRELGISDRWYIVGPVEFAGGRCTAPVLYPLYGEGKDSQYDRGGLGYYVPVHILAGIGNKSGGGRRNLGPGPLVSRRIDRRLAQCGNDSAPGSLAPVQPRRAPASMERLRNI
jgi:hypothetical protein